MWKTSLMAAALLASASLVQADVAAVQVVPIRQRTVERKLELPGSLRPWEDVELFARVAGYAKEIRVDRGSRVKARDILVVLDAPELEADVAAARARVEEAKAEVEKARAEAKLAETASNRLTVVRKETPEGVSKQMLDEAVAKALVARRTLELTQARAQAIAASLERASTLAGLTRIRAPFSGVVTERLVDPGAYVPGAGASRAESARLLRLANVSRLRLVLAVPESESRFVRDGTHATLRVDACPGWSREATVARTSGVLDPASRTLTAEIDVENADGSITAGSYARAVVTLEARSGAAVVPPRAIQTIGKKPHLALVENGVVRRCPVTVGISTAEFVEVVACEKEGRSVPPQAGVLVALDVPSSVKDGETVTTRMDE